MLVVTVVNEEEEEEKEEGEKQEKTRRTKRTRTRTRNRWWLPKQLIFSFYVTFYDSIRKSNVRLHNWSTAMRETETTQKIDEQNNQKCRRA